MSASERKWKAVIVDDEELARQLLSEMLGTHPEVEIAACCANGMEAVKAVAEHRPDLLFLDVQMPKLSGFDVLELIDGEGVAVVFVTAFDNFAMKAFEVHAVDYLLKPYSRERFDAALERAKNQKVRAGPDATKLAASARPTGQFVERIVVKDGTRVTLIPVAKLDHVEAVDDYVSLVTGGAKHLKQQTISGLEASLDPSRFVRVHRSFLVNIERVVRIEPYGEREPRSDSFYRGKASCEPRRVRAFESVAGREGLK